MAEEQSQGDACATVSERGSQWVMSEGTVEGTVGEQPATPGHVLRSLTHTH